MNKVPTIIAYLFIGLTLTRVADYVGNTLHAGPLAWLFSAGLGAAVYISSYFTRKTQQDEKTPARNRRITAWIALAFFVGVDGFFNLLDVLPDEQRIELTEAGFWIYGLFPTVAALLMGILQGYIDREKINRKPFSLSGFVRSLKSGRFASTWLVELLSAAQRSADFAEIPLSDGGAVAQSAETPLSEIPCQHAGAGCDRKFATQNAANAHSAKCQFKPIAVDVEEKIKHE